MNTEYYPLIISLHTIGIENKEIDLPYKTNYISELDKETYSFQNEEDYFNKNKEKIINLINKRRKEYGLIMDVIDIALKKIYIKKTNKNISPLFQKVKFGNQEFKLEDIMMKKILQGNLYSIYQLDKERQKEGFESLFQDVSPWILECIELKIFHAKNFFRLLECLKTQKRYYQFVRFLLLNEKDITMENFKKRISPLEEKRIDTEEINVRVRKEWLPYVD